MDRPGGHPPTCFRYRFTALTKASLGMLEEASSIATNRFLSRSLNRVIC
jgi:hypothetical protein